MPRKDVEWAKDHVERSVCPGHHVILRRTLHRASCVVVTSGERVMKSTGRSITVHRTPSTGVLSKSLSSSRKRKDYLVFS
jgi:hypothetical protein